MEQGSPALPGESPLPRRGMAGAVVFGLVVTALLGITLMLGKPKRSR